MYTLVLLRHGESIWNRDNLFTGWVDVELSEKGRAQAKNAGKILKEKGFVFDVAFASVLQRARETLDIVLGEMGLKNIPIEKSWQLNERHYGALQGMEKKEAVKKFGQEQVMVWRRGYKIKPPPVQSKEPPFSESLEDVYVRVVPYWEEKIAPLIKQNKKVLISAHGNSLRALVKELDGLSDDEVEGLNIPTGIPLVYELNNALKPIKKYYLGDPKEVKIFCQAVRNEIKI